jgi:hypothetical protein
MSHQLTFADSEFSTKRRQTRKEIFLSRMEQILPWQQKYDRCHRAVLSQGGQWPTAPIRWRPCCVFTACSIGTT